MARINGSKIIQQGNEDDLQIAVAEGVQYQWQLMPVHPHSG